MTDNIKAKGDELIRGFQELGISADYYATKAAIKAVEEIINTLNNDIRDLDIRGNVLLDLIEYWRQVINYLKSKQ